MIKEINTKHPNFLLGVISYMLLLAGVVLLTSNVLYGRFLIMTAFVAGAIHWVRAIIDVSTSDTVKNGASRAF